MFRLLQASTATSDPYFSHFDPRTEHQSYKDAQQRLEETHREKVRRVLKSIIITVSDLNEVRTAKKKLLSILYYSACAAFSNTVNNVTHIFLNIIYFLRI